MRKKLINLFIYSQLFIFNCYGQPLIQWAKCLGGTSDDYAICITQTNDGGYIIAGETSSNNGDVIGLHGGMDGWVVKLNSSGAIQWAKCFGGTLDDHISSIIQTIDGGFAFVGYTSSNDGDVVGNHGLEDIWVVKLNDTGAIQWSKCFGDSSGISESYTIIQANDGGYVIGGITFAHGGYITTNHSINNANCWIFKLNPQGSLQWNQCFGGSNADGLSSLIKTNDGGYCWVGTSCSHDFDGCNTHDTSPCDDVFLGKIDSLGHLMWTKCYGGNGLEGGGDLIQTSDGNYIIIGGTGTMNNGDIFGNHGNLDMLILKTNNSGVFQWAKCYGGTSNDGGSSIAAVNGTNIVIIGNGYSQDGDVGPHTFGNYWTVKLDTSGNIIWKKNYGSSNGNEIGQKIIHCNDGGYAIIGSTSGNNHDVTGNHGALGTFDIWVVKLEPDTAVGIAEIQKSRGNLVYPNPANNTITLNQATFIPNQVIIIFDVLGNIVYRQAINNITETTIDISKWSNGMYFYEVSSEKESVRGKFVVER